MYPMQGRRVNMVTCGDMDSWQPETHGSREGETMVKSSICHPFFLKVIGTLELQLGTWPYIHIDYIC